LLHAAAKCNFSTISTLIEFYKADINATDKEGKNALMLISGNHLDGIKCKASECNPQQTRDRFLWFYNDSHSHIDIAHYLVKQGINFKAVDNNNYTALMYAEKAGRNEIVKYLNGLFSPSTLHQEYPT